MKKLALILCFLIVSTIAYLTGFAANSSWKIQSRTIPTPASASEEMQKLLSSLPTPSIDDTKESAPKNAAEWLTRIANAKKDRSEEALADAKAHSLSIKRDHILGVPVRYVLPASIAPAHKNHLFIHVHGGAYVFSGGDASIREAILIADRIKIPVLSIDYRMPPDHPFPAAIHDVLNVYRHLITKYSPSAIAFGGTSAGGGLTLASTHKFIELNLPLPAALYVGTPWSDLSKTGDSQFTNEGIDRVLVTYDGMLKGAAQLYAGKYPLTHPLISPVYGNFDGFPPTYLVTGTRDLFLSDTVRVHRKMRIAKVDAQLNVYEGMSHAGYIFEVDAPESRQVYSELGEFLAKQLK